MRYTRDQLIELSDYVKSESQRVWLDAIIEHGTGRKAAKALGRNPSNAVRALQAIEREASSRGWAPDFGSVHPVPAGQRLRGVSTLYGADGEVKQAWVKTQEDKVEGTKLLMEQLDVLLEDIRGSSKAPKAVKTLKGYRKDVMTWYPIGDHHMGMYAWAEECGEDWDADIAYDTLVGAIDRLVDSAPPSERAALLNVGDFFHMDNSKNQTLQSGNILDVDTRWGKVVRVGIKALRYCIERMLERHQTVLVYNVLGNHDTHSAQALSYVLDALYEGNPRVWVDTSPKAFRYYQFGQCLIGMTHGDTVKKLDNFVGIMADEAKSMWGNTTFRYWYLGHIHTSQRYEFRGVLVETFRTLAARDAWHASVGYGSGRDMTAIVLHQNYGEIERHTVPVQMITG